MIKDHPNGDQKAELNNNAWEEHSLEVDFLLGEEDIKHQECKDTELDDDHTKGNMDVVLALVCSDKNSIDAKKTLDDQDIEPMNIILHEIKPVDLIPFVSSKLVPFTQSSEADNS